MIREYHIIEGPHTIVNSCGFKAFEIPNGKYAVAYIGKDAQGNTDMVSHFGVCFNDRDMAERAAKKVSLNDKNKPIPEKKTVKITEEHRMLKYYCHSCGRHTMVNTKFVINIERVRPCQSCNKPIMAQ